MSKSIFEGSYAILKAVASTPLIRLEPKPGHEPVLQEAKQVGEYLDDSSDLVLTGVIGANFTFHRLNHGTGLRFGPRPPAAEPVMPCEIGGVQSSITNHDARLVRQILHRPDAHRAKRTPAIKQFRDLSSTSPPPTTRVHFAAQIQRSTTHMRSRRPHAQDSRSPGQLNVLAGRINVAYIMTE